MHAELRYLFTSRAKWMATMAILIASCSNDTPPTLPDAPKAPTGWTSVGAVGGESSPGWSVGRFTFAGRPIAVNATCRGHGTLFVIVGWADVSSTSGPARFETAAFPCKAPIETADPSRIELAAAPLGTADVNAFVVEGPGAVERATYAVSIEERDP